MPARRCGEYRWQSPILPWPRTGPRPARRPAAASIPGSWRRCCGCRDGSRRRWRCGWSWTWIPSAPRGGSGSRPARSRPTWAASAERSQGAHRQPEGEVTRPPAVGSWRFTAPCGPGFPAHPPAGKPEAQQRNRAAVMSVRRQRPGVVRNRPGSPEGGGGRREVQRRHE